MTTVPIAPGRPKPEKSSSSPMTKLTGKSPTAPRKVSVRQPAGPVNPAQLYDTTNMPLFTLDKSAASQNQAVDQGYDVVAGAISPERRAIATQRANATLSDGKYQLPLFIAAVNLDSALSGSTALSQLTRDWYPHNFLQPSFTLIGWSLDQLDYGLLCEFIHSAQLQALNSIAHLTQLAIAGRTGEGGTGLQGDRGFDGNLAPQYTTGSVALQRTSQPQIYPNQQTPQPGTFYSQRTRGSHQPIVAQGYIATMPRIHQRFQNAVQWQVQFVVSKMIDGLYAENGATGSNAGQAPMWQAMLAAAQKDGVFQITKQVLAINKAALAFAAQNNSKLPNAETGAGASSSGSGSTNTGGGTGAGTMYDTASTSSSIPANPDAVAGYNQGNYLTYDYLTKKFPNAHHLSICVQANGVADCLDIEPGNAPTSSAGGWIKRMLALGHTKPCIYSDQNDVAAIKASIAAAGLSRDQYRYWLAAPGAPNIPTGFDAVQNHQNVSGYDSSLYSDTFFS